MKIKHSMISFLIIVLIISPGESVRPSDQINHFILTLSWPTNVCRTTSCTRPEGVTLPNYFTVHGLWPQMEPHLSERKQPPFIPLIYCNPTSKFDEKAIEPNLESLRQYWPNISNMDQSTYYSFWKDQWERHGTCVEPMFTQAYYFTRVIEIITGLDILRMLQDAGINEGDAHITASDVRAAFSGKDNIKEPYIHCDDTKGEVLVELYFCLSRDTRLFIDCKTIYQSDNDCKPSFSF